MPQPPGQVQSGYRGHLYIGIDAAASGGVPATVELGIKTMRETEIIDKHDLSCTTSPQQNSVNNPNYPVLQVPTLNGKTRIRLDISAQYSAGGAGDPPNFGGNNIYGNQYIRTICGDTIAGWFLVDSYTNTLNVDSTIDYELSLISNGTYTRTTGS